MSDYEIVHTITDWYDGARRGIADFNGKPHYYENNWDDASNDWSEFYNLKPIDEQTFKLAIEDWEIWLRWESAYKRGEAAHDTHPALPNDKERHNEITGILGQQLLIDNDNLIKAKAEFRYGRPALVKWTVISYS